MIVTKPSSPPLTRIKNHHFLMHMDFEHPVVFRVSVGEGKGRQAYLVAKAASKALASAQPGLTTSFSAVGTSWSLVPKDENGGRLWSFFNLFHKIYFNTYMQIYDIAEDSWWSSSFSPEMEIEISIPLFDHFVIQAFSGQSSQCLFEPFDREPFTDPFTQCAAKAFQRYESCFEHKDNFSPEDCDYRIVCFNEQFSLVRREHPLALNPEIRRFTTEMYLSFIREKYGDEKIREIDYRYSLSLMDLPESGTGLTPEHIYRVNIGVHNIDMNDVRRLWRGLKHIYNAPHYESHKLPLDEYLPACTLPGSQKRALFHLIKDKVKGRDPIKGDLMIWLEDEVMPCETLEEAPTVLFDQLMSLLIPGKEACLRSLTGRKIFGFIRSYYSNAEAGEIKPWVDQQELFQTIVSLRGCHSEELFLEKLVHVIVKKRLARKSLDGEYRVGLLIPAPVGEDGLQHWYHVSSCISTPTGLLNYTLHPVLAGDGLDHIKFYRSTDSDVSPNSIYIDLNPISSPGSGWDSAKKYDNSFFEKYTIALWVACTHLAKCKLKEGDKDAAYQYLLSANESLDKVVTTEYRKKDFRTIVRENDVILNDLYRVKKAEQYRRWRTSSTFGAYAKIHGYISRDDQDEEKERILARELFNQLERFSENEEDPARKYAIVHLKDQLFRHVLVYHKHSFLAGIENARTSYCDILNYQNFYSKIHDEMDQMGLLRCWIERLEFIAKELHESIEEKTKANLILAGHSLGGACASTHMVYYLVDRDRVPLPGCRCLSYLLCDPAINDQDNEKFKSWGWKHRNLFHELGIEFEIKRRLEVGDIVPLGGEAHLGATYSEEEDARLKEWLKVDFRLRERLESAKSPAIALSATAHETQFEEGKPYDSETGEGDYIETEISSDLLGKFDHRGKIATVWDEENGKFVRHEVEDEEKRKMWQELLELWKLGDIHGRIESEWVRTNRYLSLLFYFWYGAEDADRPDGRLTDEMGVFAVTDEGVISRRGFALAVSKDSDE